MVDCTCFTEVFLPSAGVEPGQLQAEDQPHWSQRLPEHGDRLPRWLPVCIWWKGMEQMLNFFVFITGCFFMVLAGFISDESEASV